jgi:DNA polymerase-3 subunit beta
MLHFKITPDQHPAFLRACRLAETVAVNRTTLPVLSAVLLTTQKRTVTIQANNLDEAVVAEFEADIVQNGQCAVMGRDLARIAALSTTLDLEAKEKGVTIKCGGTFKLAVFPPEDFPKLPEMGKVKVTTLTTGEIEKCLATVYAASEKSANRYNLQGVYLDVSNKFGVATDGKRMALSSPDVPKTRDGATIPDRACKMILALVKDGKEKSFDLAFSESSLRIDGSEASFYTKLIEGNYPNFRQALPQPQHSVKVMRDALLAALESFSFIDWETRKVQITLTKDGGSIQALGKGTSGEVSFEFADDAKFSTDISFGIDPQFLQQAVSSLSNEELSLEYTDELSPIVIKADGYAVVMPMRCA